MFGRKEQKGQLVSNRVQSAGKFMRRHRPDYLILLFAGILLLLGLVVLYAISPARVEMINQGGSSLNTAHFMQKQLVYLLIGLAGFAIAAQTPLSVWQKYAGKLVAFSLGVCVLLALLGAAGVWPALCTNGACRWYDVGFGTFQPAELLKFSLLLFAGGFLGRRMAQGNINNWNDTLMPLSVVVAAAFFMIIVVQKDLGTGITLAGILAAMLFVAGLSRKFIALGGMAVVVLGFLLIATSPHRVERMTTFFNSSDNIQGTSYHITQAKIAIGSGGLTGRGLGQSIQAFGYLPEAVNDSIFAILGENFGFIGLVSILAVFFALFVRILTVVDRVVDPTQKLIAAGVFGWLATHTVVNIGAMLGVFPLTGVTLPFLSFGGTSLLFIMLALGLTFHISRYTSHQLITEKGDTNADTRSGRGLRRSRYAGSRGYQRA